MKNLYLAFWKAQKSKTNKIAVKNFRRGLSENLKNLVADFLDNNVKMGKYSYFTIYDTKERTICAASFRERVIQHAVMNICDEVFEKYQIYDSYACRKGKGVDVCLKRTVYFCRKFKWYLKLDVHKYFDSIDHDILFRLLCRKFREPDLLKFFFDLIESYEIEKNKGIPIGNLLSQYFANMYLAVLDHELKERLRLKGYVRYMDDFICFADDKKTLKELYFWIENFLHKELSLELNKMQLNRCLNGIPFLSYRVYPYGLRLSLKAKHRYKTKIKEANMIMDADREIFKNNDLRTKLFYLLSIFSKIP